MCGSSTPYQLLKIYITSLCHFFAAHVYLLIIQKNPFRIAIINTVINILSNLFVKSLEHLYNFE